MGKKVIFTILLSFLLLSQVGTYGVPQVSAQSIPDWVKKNADWWAQGLISDRDFAAGLGFMVKERVIQVDNVEFDPNGDIEIPDTLEIPDWIKNNARWWADGVIDDNDFKSGIQHMVKEEVISFKEKKSLTDYSEWNIDKDTLLQLYSINKWNELSAKLLYSSLEGQTELTDDKRKDAWDVYSKNKDTNNMDKATLLEASYKKSEQSLFDATDILSGIKSLEDRLEETGNDQGISSYDFDKETKEQQEQIDKVKPAETQDEIDDAKNDAEKINKKVDAFIETLSFQLAQKFSNNFDFNVDKVKVVKNGGFFEGDPCDISSTSLTYFWDLEYKKEIFNKKFSFIAIGPDGVSEGPDTLSLLNSDDVLSKLSETRGNIIERPAPGTHEFQLYGLDGFFLNYSGDIFDDYSDPRQEFENNLAMHIDNLPSLNLNYVYEYEDESYYNVMFEDYEYVHLNDKLVFTVVVPSCGGALDYADISEDSLADEIKSPWDPRTTGQDKSPNGIDSVVSELNEISNKLNDVINDDDLPGLDYDLSDEEIEKLYEGLSSVIVAPEFKETSSCKGDIEVTILGGEEKHYEQGVEEFKFLDAIVIEEGPRGTINHTVELELNEGLFIIKDAPSGTYTFKVEAIFDQKTKNDIFSGEHELTGADETVIVPECTDESHLVDPPEPLPYVVPEPQPESTSYDHTLSIDYPAYRYFGDLDNCNFENDLHSVSWFLDISPSTYDVDNGVFVGKIMIEHYDGTTQYVDSPVYDEPNISWNIDAGPSGSTSYATLLDIVSPTGLSINYISDPDNEKITMTTPACGNDSSGAELEEIRLVDSLEINGKYYPYMQFTVSESNSCSSSYYQVSGGNAVSKDLSTTSDPNPGGCGFGTVSQVSRTSPVYYVSEILAWEEMTGIDLPNIP